MNIQCTRCSISLSVLTCTECSVGYYASGSSCIPCSSAMQGCLECADSTNCTLCDNAVHLIAVGGQCECQTGYFQNVSTLLCVSCSSLDPLCTSCSYVSSTVTCTSCSTGYFPSSNVCVHCNTTENGCLQCNNDGSLCSVCDATLNMVSLAGQCVCSVGYFRNISTMLCVTCSAIDALCDSCTENSGILTCISCSVGYFPVSNVCQHCSTA